MNITRDKSNKFRELSPYLLSEISTVFGANGISDTRWIIDKDTSKARAADWTITLSSRIIVVRIGRCVAVMVHPILVSLNCNITDSKVERSYYLVITLSVVLYQIEISVNRVREFIFETLIQSLTVVDSRLSYGLALECLLLYTSFGCFVDMS
ncbi:hypothetical protein TNCV_2664711 [Trichonephila clavipes]|nr:hypothetical protein TNCV_2664711 [Trichonephila clavipes]